MYLLIHSILFLCLVNITLNNVNLILSPNHWSKLLLAYCSPSCPVWLLKLSYLPCIHNICVPPSSITALKILRLAKEIGTNCRPRMSTDFANFLGKWKATTGHLTIRLMWHFPLKTCYALWNLIPAGNVPVKNDQAFWWLQEPCRLTKLTRCW